jgi:hypothetical protein
MTPLLRVTDWPWALYRVTWTRTNSDETFVRWVVSTDTTIDDDCQDRWPSDSWVRYTADEVALVKCPRVLPNRGLGGTRLEDTWALGLRLSAAYKETQ